MHKRGFTLTEMLMALLVMVFIFVAMTPVLTHRYKDPRLNSVERITSTGECIAYGSDATHREKLCNIPEGVDEVTVTMAGAGGSGAGGVTSSPYWLMSGGSFDNKRVLLTTSSNWTVPENVYSVTIELQGAGGAGGRGAPNVYSERCSKDQPGKISDGFVSCYVPAGYCSEITGECLEKGLFVTRYTPSLTGKTSDTGKNDGLAVGMQGNAYQNGRCTNKHQDENSYSVCTYDWAKNICSGSNTSSSMDNWRIPTSTELEALHGENFSGVQYINVGSSLPCIATTTTKYGTTDCFKTYTCNNVTLTLGKVGSTDYNTCDFQYAWSDTSTPSGANFKWAVGYKGPMPNAQVERKSLKVDSSTYAAVYCVKDAPNSGVPGATEGDGASGAGYGGGSGAYLEATLAVQQGDLIIYSVGTGGSGGTSTSPSTDGGNTTVTHRRGSDILAQYEVGGGKAAGAGGIIVTTNNGKVGKVISSTIGIKGAEVTSGNSGGDGANSPTSGSGTGGTISTGGTGGPANNSGNIASVDNKNGGGGGGGGGARTSGTAVTTGGKGARGYVSIRLNYMLPGAGGGSGATIENHVLSVSGGSSYYLQAGLPGAGGNGGPSTLYRGSNALGTSIISVAGGEQAAIASVNSAGVITYSSPGIGGKKPTGSTVITAGTEGKSPIGLDGGDGAISNFGNPGGRAAGNNDPKPFSEGPPVFKGGSAGGYGGRCQGSTCGDSGAGGEGWVWVRW